MSVPKKSIPSAVMCYYCAWYTFFWNGHYPNCDVLKCSFFFVICFICISISMEQTNNYSFISKLLLKKKYIRLRFLNYLDMHKCGIIYTNVELYTPRTSYRNVSLLVSDFQRSVWECSVHSCSCPCINKYGRLAFILSSNF